MLRSDPNKPAPRLLFPQCTSCTHARYKWAEPTRVGRRPLLSNANRKPNAAFMNALSLCIPSAILGIGHLKYGLTLTHLSLCSWSECWHLTVCCWSAQQHLLPQLQVRLKAKDWNFQISKSSKYIQIKSNQTFINFLFFFLLLEGKVEQMLVAECQALSQWPEVKANQSGWRGSFVVLS